jgi:catechol 2,3-dioxygenase-like lactoylglutathione lyase family enzyme
VKRFACQTSHKELAVAEKASRRRFIRNAAAVGAALSTTGSVDAAFAQEAGRIEGFDHVALPLGKVDEMIAFYRALGCEVNAGPQVVQVYVGRNMINFHRPALWQSRAFTLRAPAAVPPCGDLCFVWEGTAESIDALLARAGAKIEVGPVPRGGGRRKTGSSVYVRDPDGNLLEFIIYPAA